MLLLSLAASISTQASAVGKTSACPKQNVVVRLGRTRTIAVLVRRFDSERLRIVGVDASSRAPIAVQLCTDVLVNGMPDNVSAIRPGDLAYTLESADESGRYLGTKVDLDVYTALVLITHASPNGVRFVVVNDQTGRPVRKVFPAYLGAMPVAGEFGRGLQIVDAGRSIRPAGISSGRYAKIFGYRRVNSTTVELLRVELLRKTPDRS